MAQCSQTRSSQETPEHPFQRAEEWQWQGHTQQWTSVKKLPLTKSVYGSKTLLVSSKQILHHGINFHTAAMVREGTKNTRLNELPQGSAGQILQST